MRSVPPDPSSLDDAWGFEEQDPDSTRMVDSKELFARAGFAMEELVESESEGKAQAGSGPEQNDDEGKITLPPPLPVDEYVAKMMVRRSSHSSSEITAVQRARPSDVPAAEPPPAPSRRTIPWEPPPIGGSPPSKPGATLKNQDQLGLECDEPGVPSRPSSRLGFGGMLAQPRRPSLDEIIEDDLLREPSHTAAPGFGDLDALDSPQLGSHGWRVPKSADMPRRDRAGGVDSLSEIDFRLDLGLGFEDPGGLLEDQEPMTPPPGTLRYGLLEEEEERELRSRGGVPGSSPVYKPPVIPRRPTSIPDRIDLEIEQATAPGLDTEHLRKLTPELVPAVVPDSREQMQQRFEMGDYGGALVLAEGLLEENANDQMARQYADSCTEMLRQMYQARLGDGSCVLRLAISPDQLRSLNLDHRAGFLLSCLDGFSSIDEILDVSGMQTLEALRMLYELVQEGIIRSD